MKVMNRLTLSSLKMNRKRTIVTVVGIVLATALITAVSSMATSFQWSLVEYEKEHSGDYHVEFEQVPVEELEYIENNRNVERYFEMAEIGYAPLAESVNPDKPYLYVEAMDDNAMKNATINLTEGRLPQNDREVVISKHIKTNGGVEYHVGDTLQLEVGARVMTTDETDKNGSDETEAAASNTLGQNDAFSGEFERLETEGTKEYTIVGITERLSYEMEPRTAPGYTVITRLDSEKLVAGNQDGEKIDQANIYVTYTKKGLKNRLEVTADILQIDPKIVEKEWSDPSAMTEEEWNTWTQMRYPYYLNTYLIYYETLDISDSTLRVMYSVALMVMLIIVFTSAFCIRNSFAISITEKMMQYGMLASVGATPRQIRKNVFFEAFVLAVVGIPLGVASGVFACWAVLEIIANFLSEGLTIQLIFHCAWPAIAAACLLSIVMIYFSAAKPARRAAKVSPIVAINGSTDIKIRAKEVKAPKLVKKIFGMGGTIAYKNMKRNRKKYRVSVISIAVSVMVFVSLYSFMNLVFRSADFYIGESGYNLQVSINNMTSQYEQLNKLLEEEGVEEASIMRRMFMNVSDEALPYTEDCLRLYPAEFHEETTQLELMTLGEKEYQGYLKKLGLSYETAKDQAILVNESFTYDAVEEKSISFQVYGFEKGDVITGKLVDINRGVIDESGNQKTAEESSELTLAAVTGEYPLGLTRNYNQNGILIVSDAWAEKNPQYISEYGDMCINCENADELQDIINEDYDLEGGYISNLDQMQRENQSLYLVIAIFLYGFIAVIALIGITNIFNTITTSMELRNREFAMLRSVGMTGKEFNRMIRLESLFYGTKALIVGLVCGTILSYLIYYLMSDGIDVGYEIPIVGMLISIAVVILLLWAIMRYSLNRIRRQNIIETIRQENV